MKRHVFPKKNEYIKIKKETPRGREEERNLNKKLMAQIGSKLNFDLI